MLRKIINNKYIIVIFLLLIPIMYLYTDNEFSLKENKLLNRGYIKFDPKEYYSDRIFEDCYDELFNNNSIFNPTGIISIRLNINDGFIYNLLYAYGRENLPNIVVIVYIENNDEINGYYKMNKNLEAIEMSTTSYDKLLVFF